MTTNDLGLTVAWVAVQTTLLLVPALAVGTLASRRGPAAGAWVGALSLGLVLVLNASAFLPRVGRTGLETAERSAPTRRVGALAPAAPAAGGVTVVTGPTQGGRLLPPGWRVAWAAIEQKAAAPAARVRTWGGVLGTVFLTATAAGLVRFALGLGAVAACRRRGRLVDDPGMLALLDDLTDAIGCRPPVALREVTGLAGPATAGWRKPVILLPDDWRAWDGPERRAVLAHELAHVVRNDYAAGLLSRLAVALNAHHPLVLVAANRLRFQQEFAADALGASHAGGPRVYLTALSRLALRQDGRTPTWPARTFLPARGTLIRRIAMLRNETRTDARPLSTFRRLPAALALVGLTAAVASLRGPARGAEADDDPGLIKAAVTTTATSSPLPPLYLRDDTSGVVVIRPAAALRHPGVGRLAAILVENDFDPSDLVKSLKVDTTRPGYVPLHLTNIESLTFCLRFGKGKNDEGAMLHSIMFWYPLSVRAVAPFDWLAYLKQWRLTFTEVREGGASYYKVVGELTKLVGPDPCVYLPDDRTLVIDSEASIRRLALGQTPEVPSYLRGEDWARASRGLVAVAVNNEDGAFAKTYDLGRPDDAVVLSAFKGVDRWVFHVDDSASIALSATAACRDADAGAELVGTVTALVALARTQLGEDVVANDRATSLTKALLTNLRARASDRSVDLRTEGFGTLADFATIVEADAAGAKEGVREGRGKAVVK